ncbi:pupal cuticle protein G1A-like [Amyelois transitella]|uniref:pupal cuticle protein G1A-like n=1 Tax=Amyelois transitella TaxID=680683 RepID=UPI00298F6773|nr:pupal cuticle protein G1A-like [Amyelois transitella]
MKSMVVLFALAAVACGSYLPVAQPPHHPALVLDPHGRPLDTAEVINARAIHLQAKALEGHHAPLAHSVIAPITHSVIAPVAHSVVAPAVVAAPAAVSHQSRVDIHSSPAVVSHAVAAPILAHSAYSPLLSHGLAGHGHLLKKRSLAHIAYAAPIVAPSAVSHQSRVDIIEKPAVVSHSVVAPVISHVASPVVAHAAPIIAPSAVSHQSRVDIIEKPAVVSHSVVAPVVSHAAPVLAHAAPVAVAHVTPVVAAPISYSHQSRVDYSSAAHLTPLAHSTVLAAPASHLSHADLLHASHW